MRIEGYIPAVVTPFDAAGELMIDAFEELVAWHLSMGADAICVAGDNGEAWTLSLDERRALVRAAVKVVGGRAPVIMGASAPTAKQSIVYAEAAAEAGANVLMVGPQAYVGKATTAELTERFAAIHRAVPLPILVYNSPRRTGLNLDADRLGAVADAAPVIGLKEAARDFFQVSEILERFSERMSVLIGPCPMILWGVPLGAKGFIASGPELYGPLAARIVAMAKEAPGEEQRRLHFGLTRIYAFLMSVGTWPAALKAALGLIGLPAGLPREPVRPLSIEDRERLKALLEELGVATSEAREFA